MSDNEIFCDSCGYSMYHEKENGNTIGMSISITEELEEGRNIKKIFGRSKFNICYSCWLKSLGIKPIKFMKYTPNKLE